ncbi:hypothetical protein ACH33_13785 [Aneurinibacillus sp. XH2]|nr:hypothetical protein ACH33_13785 [Aneurinibacillus sp. XH2]
MVDIVLYLCSLFIFFFVIYIIFLYFLNLFFLSKKDYIRLNTEKFVANRIDITFTAMFGASFSAIFLNETLHFVVFLTLLFVATGIIIVNREKY